MSTNLFRLALLLGLFLRFVSSASAQKDYSYSEYLRHTGLQADECLRRSPAALLAWVAEQHKLTNSGTAGDQQDLIELFCRKYQEALRPEIDARHPKAAGLRAPLQKLFCTIFDFQRQINPQRSYVTHSRIAAVTEHALAELYTVNGTLLLAAMSHFKTNDVMIFARMKAVLSTDGTLLPPPDFDKYVKTIAQQLKVAEEADPSLSTPNIRYFVIQYLDQSEAMLNPGVP